MQHATASDFCARCLARIASDGKGALIENPAVQFTQDARNGDYDFLSDDEYRALLADTEQLAKFWDDRSRRRAGDVLLDMIEKAAASRDQVGRIADHLACLLADPEEDGPQAECAETGYSGKDGEGPDMSVRAFAGVLDGSFGVRPPKAIRDEISRRVIGQPEAVKAAALIMYNQLSGRRSSAVFCGPSGCGKSEIWRVLSREYPGMVRMADLSRFAADGWKGGFHLRDIFEGADPEAIRRNGLIMVLDEADKVVCERAVGSGGTDYNALSQNSLLKMMDGDIIEFGAEDKNPAFSVDCSKISIVMLGAFEGLLEGKARDARSIGFGSGTDGMVEAGRHGNISFDDLIKAGMRREIAGRINRIVALDPLSPDDYEAILTGPVLSGLREATGQDISIDRASAGALAELAMDSGLGVRWMRSAVLNAIDDAVFERPGAEGYRLSMKDGRLACRTRRPRKGRTARGCAPPACGASRCPAGKP